MVVDVQQGQAHGGIGIATATRQYDSQQACTQDRFYEIMICEIAYFFHI